MGSNNITAAVGTITSADATVPGPDACTTNDKESCIMAVREEGIHFRINAYMFELGCVMHSFLIGEQMLLLSASSTRGVVRPEGEGYDGGIWGTAVRVRPRNPLPLMTLDSGESLAWGLYVPCVHTASPSLCAHSVTFIVARHTAAAPTHTVHHPPLTYNLPTYFSISPTYPRSSTLNEADDDSGLLPP